MEITTSCTAAVLAGVGGGAFGGTRWRDGADERGIESCAGAAEPGFTRR